MYNSTPCFGTPCAVSGGYRILWLVLLYISIYMFICSKAPVHKDHSYCTCNIIDCMCVIVVVMGYMFCPLYQHFYLKDRVWNKFQDEFPNTSNTLDVSCSLVAMATIITELCVLCEIHALKWLPLQDKYQSILSLHIVLSRGWKTIPNPVKNALLGRSMAENTWVQY